MIGVDTNVLVRYVVQDDPRQAAAASHFIETTLSEDEPGWLASIVLCEFVWVLEAAYGYARIVLHDIAHQDIRVDADHGVSGRRACGSLPASRRAKPASAASAESL